MNTFRLEIIDNLNNMINTAKSSKDLDKAVIYLFDKLRLDGCEFIIPDMHDYVLDNFGKRNDPVFIESCLESLFYLYASEIWRDV